MTFSVILAGASVRSLAETALNDGLRPFCVDMFGDADLQQRLHAAGLNAAFRVIDHFRDLPQVLEEIDASVPLVWTGGLENHTDILQELSEQRPVCGASVEAIRPTRDLNELRRVLDGSGCRIPETHWLTTERAPDLPDDGNWLFKPRNGSGGMGIIAVTSAAAGQDLRNGWLQRRVDGRPFSATFIADESSCWLVGAAWQIAGEPSCGAQDLWFCGNIGPLTLPESVERIVREAGRRMWSLGLRGVFGIDFVAGETDLWLLEVNPRLSASHELFDLHTGNRSLLSCHMAALQASSRSEAQGSIRTGTPLVRSIIYSRRNGSLTENDVRSLLAEIRKTAGEVRFPTAWLADIPNPGPFFRGHPFCSIYRCAESDNIASLRDVSLSRELQSLLARHTGLSEFGCRTSESRPFQTFRIHLKP